MEIVVLRFFLYVLLLDKMREICYITVVMRIFLIFFMLIIVKK